MSFEKKLKSRAEATDSLLCVGLDPVEGGELAAWGINIISQTHTYVCAFKPNLAFYEAQGQQGLVALEATLEYLRAEHPDIPIIGDAKRGDIGSTSEAHARYLFDHFGFDAVTLNPYLGYDSLAPFIEREDKGSIIVCRTSNPGADEFQMLEVEGTSLWERILAVVAEQWNTRGNCSAVIGATRPDDLRRARKIVGPEMIFLVPGVGAQGGDVEAVVRAGVGENAGNTSAFGNLVINSSRGITNSPDPSRTAEELSNQIKEATPTVRRERPL